MYILVNTFTIRIVANELIQVRTASIPLLGKPFRSGRRSDRPTVSKRSNLYTIYVVLITMYVVRSHFCECQQQTKLQALLCHRHSNHEKGPHRTHGKNNRRALCVTATDAAFHKLFREPTFPSSIAFNENISVHAQITLSILSQKTPKNGNFSCNGGHSDGPRNDHG